MGEKFYLNFLSDDFGQVQIDEPIGFNALSFDFQQKDRGYGRDITFNGGESALEFVLFRNHYLEKLLYYYHYFGYEAIVRLEIVFDDITTVVGDLDFAKATTDDYEYFKCKVIQKNDIQIVKRREQTKVDLFSTKDIDGNDIDAVETSTILIKPKSIVKSSVWEQAPFNNVYMVAAGDNLAITFQANPCTNIVKSDIDNTLTFFESFAIRNTPSNYYIIDAQDKMTNVKVTISGINLNITTDTDNGGKGYVDFHLFAAYGTNDKTNRIPLISSFLDTDQNQSFSFIQTTDFVVNIPALNRGEKIWVYFEYKVSQSSDIPGNPRSECFSTITGMKTTVTSETTTYNSISTGIRLIDAIKQVVKSISGLDIYAPIFDIGTYYYNTFLLNGNLLRGLTDRPFYLSLEDISKSITECNADYEANDVVFFGNERDFYTPIECGFFDTQQFEGFEKKFNERMSINQFNFQYKNFQAQKENELINTYDTVHGQSTLTFFNKNVENKKEVTIEWIRDSFLLEEARSKSVEITTETSYQDDDKIFALDTVVNTSNKEFTETSELKHEYNNTTNYLTLKTKSEPNFKTIGIKVGSSFYINKPDKNAGTYIVISVSENAIELSNAVIPPPPPKLVAWPSSNNDGVRFTTYKYTISFLDVQFSNYTTENITNIDGINGENSYSNLRYSAKRNIINHYSEYLATCNSYWKDKPLTTTFYKNNREFTCTYLGLTTKEGEDFIPSGKILSPYFYDNVVFANVELYEFFNTQALIRTHRGYIRTIDKNNNVIKLYPKKMNYDIMSKQLTISGEDKFEPAQMTISNAGGIILINNETSLMTIKYEIKEDKLFVYDSNRQLLYNGVFWDKVSINGGYASGISQLDTLMSLI